MNTWGRKNALLDGKVVFPRRWTLRPVDEDMARQLSDELEVPSLLGRVLALRGISGLDEASEFLNAPLAALRDPFLMKGMNEAAVHLAGEISRGRPIGVYGDYDVDGITSTALLIRFFTSLGVRAPYFIPHRMRQGYGLHPEGIEQLLDAGCETIVTVDCGITAAGAAAQAREMGIRLIITDHHRPPERLPEALAVINPRQADCGYPFKGLSGVGIAFKLAAAVRRRLRDGGFAGELPNLKQHLDLVALGTVADVVPLLDENHIFVRVGLENLSFSAASPFDRRKPGVRALTAAADLKAEILTTGHVGFVLGPRLNAAGRVGEARLGVDLLTTEDPSEARALAEKLEEWNRQRRELETEAFDEAMKQIEANALPGKRSAIVLASERWHPGVIGIVASRLAEQFLRPAVLVHLDGDEGKGSARGVAGIHLYEALDRCADLLIQFGGHRGAAGLSIRRENLDAFEERFDQVARESLGEEPPEPELFLDAVVDFAELDFPLLERMELMAPFGAGNPQPMLASSGVEVVGAPGSVGRDGTHLKMKLRQRGQTIDSIGFGLGGLLDDPDFLRGKLDVAYFAEVNRWRGSSKVQIQVKALRPAGGYS
ncbi:MAG: single-stranded-DNA-specific exonuclease RecJ [bacterium]